MIIIAGGVRSEDGSILRETSGARGLQTQADRGRRGRNAETPLPEMAAQDPTTPLA